MKSLKKSLIIHGVLSVLILFLFLFTSYAWYQNIYNYPNDVLGRTKVNYFADGVGSQADPYIIAEAEHVFNLATLQNLGYFNDQQYYFKVSDLNGNPTTIDFNDPSVADIYKTIEPIGDETYPFLGYLDGNLSIIKGITIDGNGKQDIGVFGYLGYNDLNSDGDLLDLDEFGSEVFNLFIDQPTIFSNPSSTDDKTNFHTHNSGLQNRATGYIAGHLGSLAILDNVFVVAPTISSLLNDDQNRSQYGLIGFDETTNGEIEGGAQEAYDFTLDGPSAYNAIIHAQNTYSSYFINGSSSQVLGDVLSNGVLTFGYSLSTLRISPTPGDPDPVYLYDQLVADGYAIGTGGSEYQRENIDVVGEVRFFSTYYQIFQNLGAFTTPAVGSTFNPNNHPDALFLYVRPTNNPQDLGNVTGSYGGGGQLSYLSGYDSNGNYIPNRGYNNKNSPGVINFGSSGATQTMTANNAWAAIVEEADGSMTIVDETVVPDYYVFLLAVTNGQITFNNIVFEYLPSTLTQEQFERVSTVDFINADQIPTIRSNLAGYTFSLVYFNYEITSNQTLVAYTERLTNGTGYNIYIDYTISNSSFFYFDIYNVNMHSINLYINNTYVSTYTNTIVAIRFLDGSYEITLY